MPVGEGDQLAVHALIEVRPVETVGLPGELDELGYLRRLQMDLFGDIGRNLGAGRGGGRKQRSQQKKSKGSVHILIHNYSS